MKETEKKIAEVKFMRIKYGQNELLRAMVCIYARA